MHTPPVACPCDSGRRYDACCARYHHGAAHLLAPTAEALMRSRYSAYVLGLHGYVLDTWHPRTRPDSIDADPPGLKWLGLSVKRHQPIDESNAIVEFVARSRLAGRPQRLHETSRFVREGGRWYYADGRIDSGADT